MLPVNIIKKMIWFIILMGFTIGCSQTTPVPKNLAVAPANVDKARSPSLSNRGVQEKPAIQTYFKALPPEEGSLFTDTVGSLFVDNQARTVGDTVIVDIVENTTSSLGANTKAERSSTVKAGVSNFMGLAESLQAKNANVNLANLVNGTFRNDTEGKGLISRTGKITGSIGARVMGVLPNGNLNIYGVRQTKVNNETQYMVISGIIRPEDISADNHVQSTALADTKIEYYGKGVLANKQKSGWLSQIIDNVWPL